jgi:hypothetical protein
MDMPKTKTAKKQSKSDYIRAQVATLTAPEVVAKAKAAGLKLTSQLVYAVRGRAKAKRKARKTSSKAAFVRALPPSAGSWSVSQHAETLLRAVAAEIGLGHAIELLHAERTRVHSLLRE